MDINDWLSNSEQAITIKSIKPIGLVSTNLDFFNQITKPLYQAKTVQELKTGSQNIGHQLTRLGIFKSVELKYDFGGSVHPIAVNVFYMLSESPKFYASTGASVGSSQGAVVYFINFEWKFML